MTILQALFLGLLQGLTEFLPVSSSGHLAIAQHYLSGFDQPGVLFDIMLHLGTMLAVCLYFRRELIALAVSPLRRNGTDRQNFKLLGLLVLGSVPTAVIGLSFKETFEGLFHNLPVVSVMLLVTGTLLFFSERCQRGDRTEGQLTISDAILVGIAQGLAIIPGISRSGSTIATLLFKGVSGETAARFSFLLALPAVAGAALLSLKEFETVPAQVIPAYAAGTVVSFLVGLASIHLLMGVIRKRRLTAFAIYCWCAGLFFLAMNL